MAKVALSFASSILCLLLSSSFFSGEISLLVNAEWCVPKPGTPDATLQNIIDYTCGELKDCGGIQEGAQCYLPNTPFDHASFIMNFYYKTIGHNCDFNGVGLITETNPSHGDCEFI